MGKTALIVKALDSNGKLLQKTVTDVNPEATNETLATFGQMVNALTTHTYSGTDRVDKINCDTEVDTRQTPTLSLSPDSIPASVVTSQYFGNSVYDVPITYTGDGILTVSIDKVDDVGYKLYASIAKENNNLKLQFYCANLGALADITESLVVTVKASGTDTYKPAETTFTFTV